MLCRRRTAAPEVIKIWGDTREPF